MKILGWLIIGLPVAFILGGLFAGWLLMEEAREEMTKGKDAKDFIKRNSYIFMGCIALIYIAWVGLGLIIFI